MGINPFQRLPITRSTKLQTQTFNGFPDGMNVAHPAHEIGDGFAKYLQDIFVHEQGFTRRRGPLTAAVGMSAPTNKGSALIQTTDPRGTVRLAVLHGTSGVAKLGIYSTDYVSITDLTIPGTLPQAPYYIVDAKPALGGGTLIGISSQYEADATVQNLMFWNGAAKADYTTGTVTVSQAAKTVTGSGTSFTNNVSPGSYLFNSSSQFVGTVSSVDSNTQLTLTEGALYAIAGAAYTLQSLRGWAPRVATGAVTASTSSTTITGANSKFRDQGVAANWRVYRAEDNLLLGTVSAVTNNVSLTLGANSAAAMQSDAYFILSNAADYGISTVGNANKVGFLNAVYAGKQWNLNLARAADEGGEHTVRAWYSGSEYENPEAIDLSTQDGDYIPINSTQGTNRPVAAAVPAHNSLFILKSNEAFAIYGNDPSNFSVRKISDSGTLSGMSAVPYEGGVLYAGQDGVFLYDGVEAVNITEDTLGDAYRAAVKDFNPKVYRAWAFVHRDHYFLHIESVTPNVAVIKGTVSHTPTRWTIVIYLPTRSVTIHTNLDIRGAASVPDRQNTWMLVNTSSAGVVCSVDTLFDNDGTDTITCDGNTPGPDFYVESKKYNAGDGLRKKLWKQLMMIYLVGGDSLRLDTILGLNVIGQTSTTVWPLTVYWWDKLPPLFPTWDSLAAAYPTWDSLVESVFFTRRIKFLKRSQHIGFRLYQNSTNVNKVRLADIALGFKFQRPGRI